MLFIQGKKFMPCRKLVGKVNKVTIQERKAAFYGVSHKHPVPLGREDVSGK